MDIDPGFVLGPIFQASAVGAMVNAASPSVAPGQPAPYVGEGFISKMGSLKI